jgi:hypothetical protein
MLPITFIGMLMLPQNAKRNKEDCKVLAERAAFVAAAVAQELMRMPESEIDEHGVGITMLRRYIQLRTGSVLYSRQHHRTLDSTCTLATELARLSTWNRISRQSQIDSKLRTMSVRFDDAIKIFGVSYRRDAH